MQAQETDTHTPGRTKAPESEIKIPENEIWIPKSETNALESENNYTTRKWNTSKRLMVFSGFWHKGKKEKEDKNAVYDIIIIIKLFHINSCIII